MWEGGVKSGRYYVGMIRTPWKEGGEEWDSPRFLKEHRRQMYKTIALPVCLVFGIIFILIRTCVECRTLREVPFLLLFSLFRFVSRIVLLLLLFLLLLLLVLLLFLLLLLLLLLLLPPGKEEEVELRKRGKLLSSRYIRFPPSYLAKT